MNEDEKIVSIKENLEIISDFVEGSEYKYMSTEGMKEPEVKAWVEDFNLHHESFNFFFEIDHTGDRAHLESSTLAEKVCKFLNYE